MAFDHEHASPAQIQARLDKVKRRAKDILEQEHFDRILHSFPPRQRETIFNEIRALVPFTPIFHA